VYITLLVESAINQNIEYTTAQPDNTALNIKHGRPCDFSPLLDDTSMISEEEYAT